ncbi:MAG: hypothetical protein J6I95_00145 [Anaerotignum sp.]|nr:hypothetical protein [Anaerotignum sp.]
MKLHHVGLHNGGHKKHFFLLHMHSSLKKPFKNVKKFMDSDEIGGAPFIGLKSLVVKAHGSSNAKAIKNAVRQCVVFTEADIIGKIKDKL